MKTFGEGKHDNKISSFVDRYWRENFRPPSIRETLIACDMKSTSVVRFVFFRLAKSGKYILNQKDSRGIIPVWVRDAIQSQGELST